MGRQTVRTPEIDAVIIDGIAHGKPLAEICRELRIDRTIVYDWRRDDQDFDRRFARAREIGMDAIAESCLDILDEEPEMAHTEGGSRRDSAYVAWQKNRVWGRMQLLAKWDPKRYGDKVQVGGDGGGPLKVVIQKFSEEDEVDPLS